MPVVRCPNCTAELDLDPDDIGHRVECPGCAANFVAVRPTAPPPAAEPPPGEAPPPADVPPPLTTIPAVPPPPVSPPAPPPSDRPSRPPSRGANDPVTLTCPACHGSVSVVGDDLGHRVECPMCQQVFRADDPDRPSDRRSSRRGDDDEPTWRRRGSSRRDRDYDDDRPRRRRPRYQEDDAYTSDDPQAWIWKARRDLTTPGAGLEVLGWLDIAFGVLSVLIGVVAGIVEPSSIMGGPSWLMFWGNLGPGVSGVVLGAVKAMGGRQMKQAKNRPLSMAACVAGCIPLNISCCVSWLAGPSYIVGIVFGIMGLVQLLNRNVRKAFEANRPDGDIDAV